MLAWSLQVNSYGVGFGIADIFHRVRGWITPDSFSSGRSSLFPSAVRITELKFGAAESLTGYLAEGLPFNSTTTTSKALSPVFSGK
jgi:hypothetical protein